MTASQAAAPGLLLVSGTSPSNATYDTAIAALAQGNQPGTAHTEIAAGAHLHLCFTHAGSATYAL